MLDLIADPRTKDLFLIDSVLYPAAICGLYFWGIMYLQNFMKDRQPFDMGEFAWIYDMFAVSLNGGLLVFFTYYMIHLKYSAFCEPVNPFGSGEFTVSTGFYLYFLSRLLELIDSALIVLKKKHGSNLIIHCVHHLSMIIVTWLGARYVPSGSSAILAAINTAFHTVMYIYYYISLWKPFPSTSLGDVLPFRTLAVALQDVQFILVILHCLTGLYTNCGYPASLYIVVLGHTSFLYGVILWGRFMPRLQTPQ